MHRSLNKNKKILASFIASKNRCSVVMSYDNVGGMQSDGNEVDGLLREYGNLAPFVRV